MNIKRIAPVIALAVATPSLSYAHHSFSMFDPGRTVVLNGSVKELEWTNPHVWLRLMVTDPSTGKPVQYAVEMGSVARSTYDGWKPDTVKPGDNIKVSMHPNKDGSRGGMYLSAELPNGRKFGRTGPAVGLPTPRLPGQIGAAE